jgi:hypothetical protein
VLAKLLTKRVVAELTLAVCIPLPSTAALDIKS